MTAPPRSTVAAALAFAAAGWPVLPVAALGKHPLARHGVHDASVDAAQIRRWWRRWPDAGVGIATGARSGLAVVDVDVKAGGRASLLRLRARRTLPFTVLAYTGGGGFHLYYRRPPGVRVPNTVGRLPNVNDHLPGIDLRGDGGYVVAPPSVHSSGRPYRWASRQPDRPAALPRWLWPPPPPRAPALGRPCISRSGGATPYGMAALDAETETVRRLFQGQRNDGLNRAAFSLGMLVAGGELAEDLVHRQLLTAALAVGLGEHEARRTIRSGLCAAAALPRQAPNGDRIR